MEHVRRSIRVDCFLADNLSEYSKFCICSEGNIVDVALAQFFARGSEYIANSVECYNRVGDAEMYINDRGGVR